MLARFHPGGALLATPVPLRRSDRSQPGVSTPGIQRRTNPPCKGGKGRAIKSIAGFSLIEVLASVVVLSIAALGVTAVWGLADEKALYARLDNRATRILNEYAELQTFAPAYLKDSQGSVDGAEANGIPLRPGESRQGFLYHPRNPDASSGKNQPAYLDQFPYQIGYDGTAGGVLTLTYQRNPRDPQSRVSATLDLNSQ
jgi:prepilin-type N-terminal cleavage/methylation domain-containing protein